MYEFEAELWLWDSNPAVHFLTVPEGVSDDIEARTDGPRRGFGSVRVRVTVGSTTWSTSVFPDSEGQAHVLPIKKAVRLTESIGVGDVVGVSLDLVDA